MNDPCFTCPLPDCNDQDPRCAWRQTPEAVRLRAQAAAQRRRQRDRRKAADFREANAEDLIRRARIQRGKILWGCGFNTLEIAERLNVPESVVYNELRIS